MPRAHCRHPGFFFFNHDVDHCDLAWTQTSHHWGPFFSIAVVFYIFQCMGPSGPLLLKGKIIVNVQWLESYGKIITVSTTSTLNVMFEKRKVWLLLKSQTDSLDLYQSQTWATKPSKSVSGVMVGCQEQLELEFRPKSRHCRLFFLCKV